jgi:hypothetical protein
MGLSEKMEMYETKAAGLFVLTVMKGAQKRWPEIASELKSLFPAEDSLTNDQYADFEFALSVIACDLQALPNLLSADQASRIREYVLQCLSTPEMEGYPRDAIQEYQKAWDQALERLELPTDALASVLFDKLGCKSIMEFKGVRFKSPTFLIALGEKIATFVGPWWKTIIQEYKLVPG